MKKFRYRNIFTRLRGLLLGISALLCCALSTRGQLPWYLLGNAANVETAEGMTLKNGEIAKFAITDGSSPLPVLLDLSADLKINRYQGGESSKSWELLLQGNDSTSAKITFHWKTGLTGLEEEKLCIVRGFAKDKSITDYSKLFEAEIPLGSGTPLGKANVRLDYNGGILALYVGNPERVYVGNLKIKSLTNIEICSNAALRLSDISIKILNERKVSSPDLTFGVNGLLYTDVRRLGDIASKGVVGFWQPLDRETDNSWAIPSCRYRLAIVPHRESVPVIGRELPYRESQYEAYQHQIEELPDNPPLYDLYAISGDIAELKGMLFATPFADYYELRWIDASGNPILFDLNASLENNTILTLHFPLWHCTLRFSRRP